MPADAPDGLPTDRTQTSDHTGTPVSAPHADGRSHDQLKPDTIIAGKYRLKSLLGMGGMGAVYEAEHNVTRRRVAVKVMHPAEIWSPNAVERFVRESRVAAAIGHPNIVQVLDAGAHADGSPYMVLELLEGESLASRITRERTLDVKTAVWIVTEVVEALAAAHKAGVVHRDIKPENIFVTTSPENATHVKLLDFGISKITGGDLEARTLTKTGHIVGTVDYMSPEQVRGDDDIDGRTDIWAIGVLLYRALSGVLPFDGKTASMVIFNLMTVNPRPLVDLVPTIPDRLSDLVARTLEKDRTARHPHAKSLLDDLRNCLEPLAAGTSPRVRTSVPGSASAAVAGGAVPSAAATGPGASVTDVGHALTIESSDLARRSKPGSAPGVTPPGEVNAQAAVAAALSIDAETPAVTRRRSPALVIGGIAVLVVAGAFAARAVTHSTPAEAPRATPSARVASPAVEQPSPPPPAPAIVQAVAAVAPSVPEPVHPVVPAHAMPIATRHGARRPPGAAAAATGAPTTAPQAASAAPATANHNAPVVDINGM